MTQPVVDSPMRSKSAIATCEDRLFIAAEKELAAFVQAVDQLFGPEQARQAALGWIRELEMIAWPAGEPAPHWREVTVRAGKQIFRAA